jgi:hypothetical protein
MEQISTSSILSLFDTTKEERRTFVEQVVQNMDDPLRTHYQIKCMEEVIKAITGNDEYRSEVLSRAEKHGKSFDFRNAEFSIRETGVSYDWSFCQDEELNDLIKAKEVIEAKIKGRQEFLKTVPVGGMTIVDEETGEIIKIYPPVKRSTTSVAVKLK